MLPSSLAVVLVLVVVLGAGLGAGCGPRVGDEPCGLSEALGQGLGEGEWIWVHPGWRTDLVDGLYPLPVVAADRVAWHWLGRPRGTLLLLTRPREAATLRLLRGLRRSIVTLERLPDLGTWQAWRIPPPELSKKKGYQPPSLRSLGVGPDQLEVWRVPVAGPSVAPVACPWSPAGRRHACPGPAWNNVRGTSLSSGGERRSCLWVHPVAGAAMELRWPRVRLGEALLLAGAYSDHAARTPRGAAARMDLLVGGRPQGYLDVPNSPGWKEARFPTDSGEESHDVTLRVKLMQGQPGARHLCVGLAVVR